MMGAEINSQRVKDLFEKLWEIPEYQRHYSWGQENCEKLWDDIAAAFEEDKNSEYFLGSLVAFRNTDDDPYSVIDGQQRLTSLLLILKALHARFNKSGLLNFIWVRGEINGEYLEDKYRIDSNVYSESGDKSDKTQLIGVLKADYKDIQGYNKTANRFEKNCQAFYNRICDWAKEHPEQEEKLLVYLLNKVKVSFINAGENEDQAIRIFNTVNDRGMPLGTEDIIKSKIFAKLNSEKREKFAEYWADNERRISQILRDYSFVIQSKTETKFVSLKDFFQKELQQKDVKEVLNNIEWIEHIQRYIEQDLDVKYWFNVIYCWPGELARYPYIAYMIQHSTFDSSLKEPLSFTGNSSEIIEIILNTMRFVFLSQLARKRRDVIERRIVQVCRQIMNRKPLSWPDDILPKEDQFEELLQGSAYKKGILALYHFCNEEQIKEGIDSLDKFEVEHILPRKHYLWPQWQNAGLYVDYLGNFILLEKDKNIRVSNMPFFRKREEYKNSALVDVRELARKKEEEWTPQKCQERAQRIIDRLRKFFYP